MDVGEFSEREVIDVLHFPVNPYLTLINVALYSNRGNTLPRQ